MLSEVISTLIEMTSKPATSPKGRTMRVQLALNVTNLDESIEFYEKMFDTTVAKKKDGYANFEIPNPPLKLVLFEGAGPGGTLNHLGVEVEEAAQVSNAEIRMTSTGLDTSGIDDTMCCYAEKTETWVEGPDTRWEWYVKTGDANVLENVIVGGANACCPPAVANPESGAGVEVTADGGCC